jgi:hypothetical protein
MPRKKPQDTENLIEFTVKAKTLRELGENFAFLASQFTKHNIDVIKPMDAKAMYDLLVAWADAHGAYIIVYEKMVGRKPKTITPDQLVAPPAEPDTHAPIDDRPSDTEPEPDPAHDPEFVG